MCAGSGKRQRILWPRSQERIVPVAMRSSSELVVKMKMSTRLRRMRALVFGDNMVFSERKGKSE